MKTLNDYIDQQLKDPEFAEAWLEGEGEYRPGAALNTRKPRTSLLRGARTRFFRNRALEAWRYAFGKTAPYASFSEWRSTQSAPVTNGRARTLTSEPAQNDSKG